MPPQEETGNSIDHDSNDLREPLLQNDALEDQDDANPEEIQKDIVRKSVGKLLKKKKLLFESITMSF